MWNHITETVGYYAQVIGSDSYQVKVHLVSQSDSAANGLLTGSYSTADSVTYNRGVEGSRWISEWNNGAGGDFAIVVQQVTNPSIQAVGYFTITPGQTISRQVWPALNSAPTGFTERVIATWQTT